VLDAHGAREGEHLRCGRLEDLAGRAPAVQRRAASSASIPGGSSARSAVGERSGVRATMPCGTKARAGKCRTLFVTMTVAR